jgi:LMBR1 domain-containing protein 1
MWFVIITAVILMVISLVVNFYILVYFSSEEDKNAAYFPKALTLLGLTLAELLVLLLPLDVANKNEKVLDMQILWFVFFVTIAALVIVIFPFAIFYYEEEDDQVGAGKQCATALKYTVVCGYFCVWGLAFFWLLGFFFFFSLASPRV